MAGATRKMELTEEEVRSALRGFRRLRDHVGEVWGGGVPRPSLAGDDLADAAAEYVGESGRRAVDRAHADLEELLALDARMSAILERLSPRLDSLEARVAERAEKRNGITL